MQMPYHSTKTAHALSSKHMLFSAALVVSTFAWSPACPAQMQMQAQGLAQARVQANMQAQNRAQPDQPQDGQEPTPTPQEPPHNPSIRDFVRHNNTAQPQPSTLPPTQPTSMPAANTLPSPMAATSLPESNTVSKPHRAKVTFSNGLIDVRADDSSLNQILRSISHATGLQITGGVADQRVFGNYGPASTSEIIATLLDGTGTNMLLTEGDATTPPTLLLTPRSGGATPPSPNAAGADDDVEISDAPPPQAPPQAPLRPNAPPAPRGFAGQAQAPVPPASVVQTAPANPLPVVSGPQPIPPPQNNVLGSDQNVTPTASQIPTTNSVPTDALPTPSTTASGTGGQGIVDTPNPPAPDSTTGSTPATAESIYQQLLKMQQQKQQQQSPPAAAPTPTPSPQ